MMLIKKCFFIVAAFILFSYTLGIYATIPQSRNYIAFLSIVNNYAPGNLSWVVSGSCYGNINISTGLTGPTICIVDPATGPAVAFQMDSNKINCSYFNPVRAITPFSQVVATINASDNGNCIITVNYY